MNLLHRAGTVFLFSSLVPFSAHAQKTAQQEAASPVVDHRIVLDVVVHNKRDRSNKPVAGLHVQDFVVLDDKKPQKVLSFEAIASTGTAEPVGTTGVTPLSAQPDPPAEIVLLVDEVNVGFDRVAYERNQIKKYAMQNGGKLTHPTSLFFFSDHGSQTSNGTTQDGNQLVAAFDQHQSQLRISGRSQGFYGGVDRFQFSLSTLHTLAVAEGRRPGRKLVIWISPGWWYLSGPNIQLTRREENGLFASIVAASNELRRARVTLYSIDPLGIADAGGLRVVYYREFLKPVTRPGEVDAGDLALQVIATQTGGLALNSSNDIAAQITQCVSDADAFYTLTFEPQPSEKPNQFHPIEVKMETPGLIARTRNGYYGQP